MKNKSIYNFNVGISHKFNVLFGFLNALLFKHDIRCKIPLSTRFKHYAVGTTISAKTKIGENCIICQNVTIGVKNGGHPLLEDGVVVCGNSVIIGPITIGKNSIIGAGAVVLKNIPPYSLVIGNPARIIKRISKEEYRAYRQKRY